MVIKLHESFAIHPGPWLLEEFIKPYNMTVSSTAKHLHVARPVLSRWLNGKAALTPDIADRFEAAFGVPAATILKMQATHDLSQVRSKSDAYRIERLPKPS